MVETGCLSRASRVGPPWEPRGKTSPAGVPPKPGVWGGLQSEEMRKEGAEGMLSAAKR